MSIKAKLQPKSKNNRYSKVLGQKLRAIRLSLGFTQAQILSFIRPGVDSNRMRAFVSQWESGKREPVRQWLIRYAEIANIDLDTLLRDDRKLPRKIIKAAEANCPERKSRVRSKNSKKLSKSSLSEKQNDVKEKQPEKSGKKARTIAVYSNEQGSGKTVTAAQLALRSVISGQRVLLVDMSDEYNSGPTAAYFSYYLFRSSDETGQKNFYSFLFSNHQQEEAFIELRENLYLIKGGFDLHRLDEELVGSVDIFEKAFEKLKRSFDLIIFDLPSEWNIRNKHTLRFANEVVIPFNLSKSYATSLSELFHKHFASIAMVGEEKDSERRDIDEDTKRRATTLFKQIYIVPNRFDDRSQDADYFLDKVYKVFDDPHSPEYSKSHFKYGNIKMCKPIPYSYKLQSDYCQEKSIVWFQEDELIADTYQSLVDEIVTTGE